jgi:hypothetical protein
LQALTENGIVFAPDLRLTRSGRVSRPLSSNIGVRSMVSYRLFLPNPRRSALNIYATHRRPLTSRLSPSRAIFASCAASQHVNRNCATSPKT